MARTDSVPSGRPHCDFLALLPISDGIVTIRAMSAADAEAYASGTEDALVKRFAHLPLDTYTPQIVRTLIDGAIADGLRDGALAVLAICDARSNQFLGSLVFFDVTSDDAEIGYWVAPEHRGLGVAVRALALAIEMAGALSLKQLRAKTVEENPPSQKVLLTTGFEPSGDVRPEVLPSGRTQMSITYLFKLGRDDSGFGHTRQWRRR